MMGLKLTRKYNLNWSLLLHEEKIQSKIPALRFDHHEGKNLLPAVSFNLWHVSVARKCL